MNKKNLFCFAAVIPIVAIATAIVNVNSSETRGLPVISKANIEVLANGDGGQGIYKEERTKDAGRVNVMKDGILENCQKIEQTCYGTGTLFCFEFVSYSDCKPL